MKLYQLKIEVKVIERLLEENILSRSELELKHIKLKISIANLKIKKLK